MTKSSKKQGYRLHLNIFLTWIAGVVFHFHPFCTNVSSMFQFLISFCMVTRYEESVDGDTHSWGTIYNDYKLRKGIAKDTRYGKTPLLFYSICSWWLLAKQFLVELVCCDNGNQWCNIFLFNRFEVSVYYELSNGDNRQERSDCSRIGEHWHQQ